MRSISEAEKGYLAATIDDEGSICISRMTKNNRYFLVLSICNTSKVLIDYVHSLLPNLNLTRKDFTNGQRTVYLLRQSDGAVAEILEFLEPYIIAKKPQVKLAINFSNIRNHGRGKRYSAAEKAVFAEYYNEMKYLNSGGTYA